MMHLSDFPNHLLYLKRVMSGKSLEYTGRWQSSDAPAAAKTREMLNVSLTIPVGDDARALQASVRPNLPWAEDHFAERVSGSPMNPAPSHAWWPFAMRGNAEHMTDSAKFSHTYPERMNVPHLDGVRYQYGNLEDVLALLIEEPLTRQAYLPIWFPEDTGVRHGERVPCSIGYHFLVRDGKLHCWYQLRSCDLMRHFQDDVYMAGRLMQWVCVELREAWRHHHEDAAPKRVIPGNLHVTIGSLHTFAADTPALMKARKEWFDGIPNLPRPMAGSDGPAYGSAEHV